MFKDIPWYEWFYEINKFWIVKSKDRIYILDWKRKWQIRKYKWKIIKQEDNWKWYKHVTLRKNWIKTFRIHRLVLLTFVWFSDLEVNHINWIKDDNRLENLEYCSRSDNIKHSYRKLNRINWMKWKIPWNKKNL